MYEDSSELWQTYDKSGESIESIMRRLIGQQQMIASTLQEIKETNDEVEKNRSQIVQTASEIRQEVVQQLETLDGQITQQYTSLISQTANEINLQVAKKVGNDQIISSINLSPETIKISASKIELQGAVTFSALSSDVQSTINNKADYAGVTTIVGGVITSDTVNLGRQLILNGSGQRGIQFASGVFIGTSGGIAGIQINAADIFLNGRVFVNGVEI